MKVDRVGGLVFFLLGAAVTREGLRLPYMAQYGPGPGMFPTWLGGVMMLLSLVLFLTTRRKDRPFLESLPGFRKASMVVLSFVVYVVALSYLGLLIALALFLGFLLAMVEKRGWRTSGVVAILGSLGCYLVFKVWLHVPLPSGVLGI